MSSRVLRFFLAINLVVVNQATLLAQISPTDAVSREVSVLRFVPVQVTDVVSREVSVLRRVPVHVTDAVSREYSLNIRRPDLEIANASINPNVIQQNERQFTLSWMVANVGDTGTTLSWLDRVVLSSNETFGDTDDLVLGEFPNPVLLARMESYNRSEMFSLPTDRPTGRYFLFVRTNANSAIAEAPGLPQGNNLASTTLEVLPLPATAPDCMSLDQASGSIFPVGTKLALSGRAVGFGGIINVLYTIDVSFSTQFVHGLDCNFNGVLDPADDMNGDGVGPTVDGVGGSILDCEIGAMLILDQLLAQNASTVRAGVIFSGGTKKLDVGPEVGQQTWMTPFDRDANNNGVIDFEEVIRTFTSSNPSGFIANSCVDLFTRGCVGQGTNLEGGITASEHTLSFALPSADRQLVLFLTDGNEGGSTFPTDAELEALANRGIEFRLFIISAAEVTPKFQNMAAVINANPNSVASARAVLDEGDLLFELVQSLDIINVTVNGQQASSVDAAGRFFHIITIKPGQNCFDVVATDASGGECVRNICFVGVEQAEPSLDQLSDVTTSLDVDYLNTTMNRNSQVFVTHARARNVADTPLDGPVLMVIDKITDPSVTAINPDGILDDGRPYFVMVDQTVNPVLAPGEYTSTRPLTFNDPNEVRVSFDISWLALGNSAPFFTTVPPVAGAVGISYQYNARAQDPDNHSVAYKLEIAPAGMTVSATTGGVSWIPTTGQAGSHSVQLVATDSRGGRAEQNFVIDVASAFANRPPSFASAPVTRISVGAPYSYQATATDPDGDALTFAKLSGPAELTVGASGLVSWALGLPGNHTIAIRVSDGNGGQADQVYVLTVGERATNPNAPTLFGTPPVIAAVENLYLYQASASDPDPFDVLTFSLSTAPPGMTVDPANGRVTWTPSPSQVGPHSVVLIVEDGNGASASQSWTVEVFLQPPNQSPIIESVPNFLAIVGDFYQYQVSAFDPETEPVTYQLFSSPVGMTIDATLGLISWTPSVAGTQTVAVQAFDLQGNFGSQVYDLQVQPVNDPPLIVSTPVLDAVIGGTYRYDVDATDPNFNIPDYFLISDVNPVPTGMTINRRGGLIAWTPDATQVGSHLVTVRAADQFGAFVEQTFTITVAPDVVPPKVHIAFSSDPAQINEIIDLCVQAGDNVGIAGKTLTADGLPLTIDATGCTTFTSAVLGVVTFDATATDPAGNVGTASEPLQVVDPTDAEAPVVVLGGPAPGSLITGPTEIIASITDNAPTSLVWEVKVAPLGSANFKTIGQGTGEVLNGIVAVFDPTLLPNDEYRLQIVASDGIQSTSLEIPYSVCGDFKLGNFTMTFTDLTIPVAGIPLVITRTYDSLDTSVGDFGAGWRLQLPGKIKDTPAESNSGDAFIDQLSAEPYVPGTRVYVTRPDGRRVGFTFVPEVASSLLGFVFRPKFVPDPGVTDTLTAPFNADGGWLIGGKFFEFIVPYNPRTFVLRTKQGVEYTIDEFDGLRFITDINGNTIDVRPDGLFSSTGVALLFQRDAQGRITKIIEPDDDPTDAIPPGELNYAYDITGNLFSFADQRANTTNFFYEDGRFPNYLTRIVDPLNRPTIRSVFDNGGRLIAICDANGDPATLAGCTTFANDPVGEAATVINPRGFRTDLVFDQRGNVLLERRWLDGVTFLDTNRTYDANDNLLSVTDPEGNVFSFTYDARGNQLTRTDPAGRTFEMTYDPSCDEVDTRTDPMGNVTVFQYDGACNLRFTTDALGGVTEIRYNTFGQPTDLIDAVGNVRHFDYDAVGFPIGFTDPLGHSATVRFNVQGELEFSIDRIGRRIDFTYDELHRQRTETWDSVPPRVTTFDYNAVGQIISAIDPDSSLTLDYFPTGLLQFVDNAGTPGAPPVRMDYAYDANGNVTRVADSLGGVTEYQYDALDRLVRIQQSGAGVNEKRVDFTIDNAGLVRQQQRFADLAGTLGVANTFFDYDCSGCPSRVTSIHHRKALDNSVLLDLDFNRDDLGNILQMTDAEGIHSYTYDGLRRLLTADHPIGGVQPNEFYDYDPVGNRLSSHLSASHTYSYQLGLGGAQLRQDDQFDYEYDNNGSLILQTDRVTGERTEFTYNHRDRLILLERFSVGQATPLVTASYVYDAANRRIRTDEGGVVHHFAYDGQNPMVKLDGAGTIVSRRLYDRRVDGIWADEDNSETRWFLIDQVGTVRSIVSNDSVSLNRYVYDSFGRVLLDAAPMVDNDLRFTSRELSDSTGVGYFRARFYDSLRGRFISEDPRIPFLYQYADNNPIVFVDATGEAEELVFGVKVGIAASILTKLALPPLLGLCLDHATDSRARAKCVRKFLAAETLVDTSLLLVGVPFSKLVLTGLGLLAAAVETVQ